MGDRTTTRRERRIAARQAQILDAAARVFAERGFHRVTTREIAQAMQVPPSYLAKVMRALMRSGVVHSMRGVKGGFQLQKPADQLSLLEVVSAVTTFPQISECPLGLDHDGGGLCGLHTHMAGVWQRLQADLGGVTLQQILEKDRQDPSLPERLESLRPESGRINPRQAGPPLEPPR